MIISRCFLAVIYLFSPNDRKTHDLTLTFGNESLNFSSILQVSKTKENQAVCSIKSNFPNKKYTPPPPPTLKKNTKKTSNERIMSIVNVICINSVPHLSGLGWIVVGLWGYFHWDGCFWWGSQLPLCLWCKLVSL